MFEDLIAAGQFQEIPPVTGQNEQIKAYALALKRIGAEKLNDKNLIHKANLKVKERVENVQKQEDEEIKQLFSRGGIVVICGKDGLEFQTEFENEDQFKNFEFLGEIEHILRNYEEYKKII